jgi:hypothetical protein
LKHWVSHSHACDNESDESEREVENGDKHRDPHPGDSERVRDRHNAANKEKHVT